MRAFVELRGMLHANQTLATKVHPLEHKVSVHECSIAQLADSMAEMLAAPSAPPKRPIGFVSPNEQPTAGKALTKAARQKL